MPKYLGGVGTRRFLQECHVVDGSTRLFSFPIQNQDRAAHLTNDTEQAERRQREEMNNTVPPKTSKSGAIGVVSRMRNKHQREGGRACS